MKRRVDLDELVANKIITKAQAEKILSYSKSGNMSKAWRFLYWIAGLFIGLGTILLISANWDDIPSLVKVVADFAIWGGVLYATYWSVINKKERCKELFLTLSCLFVGATIGLVAQIFNLGGNWSSFALSWSLLSLIFVLCSRLTVLNMLWIWVICSSISEEFIEKAVRAIEKILKHYDKLLVLIYVTVCFAVLAYLGKLLYDVLSKKIVLPKAFYYWNLLFMYGIAMFGGGALGFDNNWANVFVFAFLACRMLLAFKDKSMRAFVFNTHLVELYILFLFISRFNNLFDTGVGFLMAGFLILTGIYVLRKTYKYIKKMEIFNA
ncbi:MAG: DUF2157 domain-containing protein [Alphaproteobacteria bacterium]|nr:DUF2157 domain-containing protein [Alphaproteobacteria bacterium]